MNKTLQLAIGIATLIGMVFGIYFWVDKTYAKCERVQEVLVLAQTVDKRLEYKIQDDILKNVRQRYWSYTDKYGQNGERAPDDKIKSEMKELKQDFESQDRKVKQLEGVIK
jgi:hypothetical protein